MIAVIVIADIKDCYFDDAAISLGEQLLSKLFPRKLFSASITKRWGCSLGEGWSKLNMVQFYSLKLCILYSMN